MPREFDWKSLTKYTGRVWGEIFFWVIDKVYKSLLKIDRDSTIEKLYI